MIKQTQNNIEMCLFMHGQNDFGLFKFFIYEKNKTKEKQNNNL